MRQLALEIQIPAKTNQPSAVLKAKEKVKSAQIAKTFRNVPSCAIGPTFESQISPRNQKKVRVIQISTRAKVRLRRTDELFRSWGIGRPSVRSMLITAATDAESTVMAETTNIHTSPNRSFESIRAMSVPGLVDQQVPQCPKSDQ